ncbi:MAG: AmmeMemoRadiSam system radical SAM enzyme [Nitrospinae bacterium]|nr:AmmeMemoRadiSam system radical SAM enzyme [Nitrospinota bacterium]
MAKNVEALYWEPREGGAVQCKLCPVRCLLKEGKTGVCMAKKNIGGKLIATAYGLTTAFNYDPIEKKPLYHFHPGATILSLGPNACNMGCQFCQNFQISQQTAPTRRVEPSELVAAANVRNCVGVAYTYTEPLMWYEYVLDAAYAVKRAGLKNVLVSNGYLEPEPFDHILPLIDALNIDIKSMDEEFYRKICKGKLAPVLRNVEHTAGKAHIEITNLVIPGLNDSDDNFERLAKFIAGVDPFMPLHFSRYHPMYKMENPMTPVDTLLRAGEISRQYLKYVFIGNVEVPGYDDTHCPSCNALLIRRQGFSAEVLAVENGHCVKCGTSVKIVGV